MLRLRRPLSCDRGSSAFQSAWQPASPVAGQQKRPCSGAASAHAHDQSPDHSGWIVMDDLQGAALQFRCHASPFGRDNCRLLAGSTVNCTASLGSWSRSKCDSQRPRRHQRTAVSAAVRIARLVGDVKGFLTSTRNSLCFASPRRRDSPVYSSARSCRPRVAQHSRSVTPHETRYWNYRFATARRQPR